MKISNGGSAAADEIEFTYVDERYSYALLKTTKTTAGANKRSITAGKRLVVDSEIRATQAEYLSLINLLTDNSLNYYWTPQRETEFADLFSGLSFPLQVNIEEFKSRYVNMTYYDITLSIESVELIV